MIAARLKALAAECGEPLRPGASEADVVILAAECIALFGAEPPRAFLWLLRAMDGFEANGLRVFGTRELVEHNQAIRDPGGLDEYLVLAEGSSARYAVHLPTQERHELGIVPTDVLAVHRDLTSLLTAAVNAQS
ncbi:hypothetical protein GCM10023215_60870 [Pseudonocardia yuanmonensis]|uniref:SMI1/KNR4 family protein n=1 Tax=Pseudonocardia yuanmonensis TaxID=1095914 RepID=A0ABP8XQC7_9PSEU